MARVNGFRVSDIGQLRVVTTGTPVSWMGGIPFDEHGDVIANPNPPDPSDPYVGGIRISPTGVCMTAAPPPAIPGPINTVPPSISGNTVVGGILTCDPGAWLGIGILYIFQWYSDAAPVGGNTTSYVIQATDVGKTITCQVTAVGANGGETTVASNGILIP